MVGFAERFEFYKQITNQCLQYAIDCKYIKIMDNLQVKIVDDNMSFTDPSLSDSMNLASKLFKLFKSWNVINIYLAFGIKKL
ncbi:hypothetical protein EZS27_028049 [termite gut metagenome]|uniref:Uncharacterized protein n=1 Tax=termite gut metagenome TaxID=433724 RepID=A0A5J4QKH9_9ZZZZ